MSSLVSGWRLLVPFGNLAAGAEPLGCMGDVLDSAAKPGAVMADMTTWVSTKFLSMAETGDSFSPVTM
ncbi:hypothetical protein [Variovorax paradoxus]|uniref:hypothetical protein n=1 Tax=Variovorax paradoxus TaxID=34073 RepID=UPI0027D87D1C|nr:hypothetical protein [Variovorax paradoxus]